MGEVWQSGHGGQPDRQVDELGFPEPLHEWKRPAGCEIFFPDLSMLLPVKLAHTEWKLISKHLHLSDWCVSVRKKQTDA